MALTSKITLLVTTTRGELATGLHVSEEPDVVLLPAGAGVVNLSTTSSPAISKAWSQERALAAGADTIDLTALPEGNFAADQDFTGLKVQVALIHVLATATVAMTFSAGATNPYNLFGASGQIELGPDDWCLLLFDETTPDVAAGAKEIDVAGSGTESYEIQLAAG